MQIFSTLVNRAALNKALKPELQKIATALHGLDYALVGAAALNMWVSGARGTNDFDFVLFEDDIDEARDALSESFSIIDKSDRQFAIQSDNVRNHSFDFLFAVGFNPEGDAINKAKVMNVIGVKIPVAQPKYLAWWYALSGRKKHLADMEELFKKKLVDPKDLLEEIEFSMDPSASKAVRKVLDGIKAGMLTNSEFEDSGYPLNWEDYQDSRTLTAKMLGWESKRKNK